MVQQSNTPAQWSDSDILDGLDLIDKAELVGVPFRINGFRFYTNERGIAYVEVDAERADGSTFSFNDSSSGVRVQMVNYVTAKGNDAVIASGDYTDAKLVVPNGLRVSEYETKDDRGRDKKARTYYLTTSGKRAGQAETKATAKRR